MKPSSSRVASLTGRDVGTHRGTRVFDLLTSTAACWGGVVDDLPEVSVGVAEVAGVDAPGAVVRAGHGGAGLLGLEEEGVDIGAVCARCPRLNSPLCAGPGGISASLASSLR